MKIIGNQQIFRFNNVANISSSVDRGSVSPPMTLVMVFLSAMMPAMKIQDCVHHKPRCLHQVIFIFVQTWIHLNNSRDNSSRVSGLNNNFQ